MNKHIKKIIILASLALVLTGCEVDQVDQENPNEDTQIEDQLNEEQEDSNEDQEIEDEEMEEQIDNENKD